MKRGRATKWTVDWTHTWEPPVGGIVKRITETSQDGGYWRVTGIRQVKPRSRLPDGYIARYVVHVEYVGEVVDEPVVWTCHAWGKRNPRLPPMTSPLRKVPSIDTDPFSPLLPADESE